ncbi:MAG: 5-methyltetrahydropteroyltriglutamate--homocysteine S-methyltransferase [Myxococcota bacterium]|nr:5-methyltetrahydropteroyltriglutamate--homocysteine S-methyltransferase [Myxococcota bacterium]MDW8360979.1 5-methyltetrahydropteroyltriglutamate--homocysteine S-methyltransferase [Myxococcales bacterium]
MRVLATCLGFPRIGVGRELKWALESFWAGTSGPNELHAAAAGLRERHWKLLGEKGIDHVPSNDFSLYDHVLDMAVTLGVVPTRYRAIADPLARLFAMARGFQDERSGMDVPALEMTKWFDTNYHYIVPELEPGQRFELDASKVLGEIAQARALGVETRPVLLGPVSFLLLAKRAPSSPSAGSTLDALEALLETYERLLAQLAESRVAWVQLDEPCLVTDLGPQAVAAYRTALPRLAASGSRPRMLLATYFGALGDNASLALDSGFDALHVDLVRAPLQLDALLAAVPSSMILSLGLVDGRNVWRTDLDAAADQLDRAVAALGPARVWVGPSCSLLHVPVDLDAEKSLDAELRSWMAFAVQKLEEIRALADAAGERGARRGPAWDASRHAVASRRASSRTCDPAVRRRVGAVDETMLRRSSPYAQRSRLQRARLQLPALPTTTIGSFPQTAEVRRTRASWKAGRLDDAAYESFLRDEVGRCVRLQERLGLDVLVHGEFERTDMVEHFAERLCGYAFTEHGWVQSYGSRCVRPPVLYGDVARPQPMTVSWARYAQSLTRRPVKGMLTGPVTMLQWSFVRNDLPRDEVCMQVALALRDEVADLEAAGIGIVQVDEPAIREGLPLRAAERDAYLQWAVRAFRLATSGVRDETQIHTHMCYSQFGDMLDAIAAMDADVLSIESSRSEMELLDDFARFRYPNEIGPGVYDVHSPRVPSVRELVERIERALRVLPPERVWVNPDCGLKTRGWPEVEAALERMVQAARQVRARLAEQTGATAH